jgi:hypothetical protein
VTRGVESKVEEEEEEEEEEEGEEGEEEDVNDDKLVLVKFFEALSGAATKTLTVAATGDTKREEEDVVKAAVGVAKDAVVVAAALAGDDFGGEPTALDDNSDPGPVAVFGSGESDALITAGDAAAFLDGDNGCGGVLTASSSEAAGFLALIDDKLAPAPESVIEDDVETKDDGISRFRS